MGDSKAATHLAILAPVPQCHLDSVPMGPRVAFATMAWELFKKDLPENCGNRQLPIDVFIYASGPEARYGPVVSYRATYVQLIEDKYTVQQTGYRPPSTETDADDFCVFWVVEDLHQLPENVRIPVAQFRPYQKDSSSTDRPHKSKLHKNETYEENFIPRRPLLVEHPHLTLL
jgi:hypothetical protein